MEERPLYVEKTEYREEGDLLIAYVSASWLCRAEARLGDTALIRRSNLREPYDFRMHIFEIPKKALESAGSFTLDAKAIRGIGSHKVFLEDVESFEIRYDAAAIVPMEEALTRADRRLRFIRTDETGENSGVTWKSVYYETQDGAPVHIYTCRADASRTKMIAGTPDGETEFRPKVLATVMEEAVSAREAGHNVLFASNADFFEIFGDGRPSGLCVHEGHTVAGADAVSPMIAVLKNGQTVIGYPDEFNRDEILEAVSGGQILIKNGKVNDLAVLEPFGEVAHPRTAFGIAENGDLIVIISDGRRPKWSNGTALCELAQLMLEEGAVTAMNADGGGSSTFIVNNDGELTMLNHPADLYLPDEDLIRPLFDSLLIVAK